MFEPSQTLGELVGAELATPSSDAAHELADEIRRRHGPTVSAVLFYGSCLRRKTDEGVLDFYVLVDDYRRAHRSRLQAWANAALPPSVLWIEQEEAGVTLRSKYAVMTVADFARGCSPGGIDGRVWARFSQPARLVWVRDSTTRQAVEGAVATAVCSLVRWMIPWMPHDGTALRFTSGELWRFAFSETYRTEWRSERKETIASLHASDPVRYEAATRSALARIAHSDGFGTVSEESGRFALEASPSLPAQRRRAWSRRRLASKAVLVLALIKTAFTQDDWVSYVLWKLERHSGERIEVTDAQRRYPLLLGWPVIFRIWRRGILR